MFLFIYLFIFGSVMYILCNEEPLWMSLCLKGASGLLQYKGSWKKTALHKYVFSSWFQKSIYYLFWRLFEFLFNANIFEIGHFDCSESLPDKYKECHQRPLHFDGMRLVSLFYFLGKFRLYALKIS